MECPNFEEFITGQLQLGLDTDLHYMSLISLFNRTGYSWMRRKWKMSIQPQRNWTSGSLKITIGDVVLIVDDALPRNMWKLALVDSVNYSDDSLVRSVRLKIPYTEENKLSTFLDQPIHKLCLLVVSGSIPRQ
jgi:hypothetical protein